MPHIGEDNIRRRIQESGAIDRSTHPQQDHCCMETWRTFSFGSVQQVQKHPHKVPMERTMSPCVMSISPWLQATHGPTVTAVMYEAMNHEYTRYIETGNVFAEPCLDLPCIDHQSIVNPTLFEREDKIYSLDFTCLPFEDFHHGFVVSKAIFQKAGLSLNAAGQPLVVEDGTVLPCPPTPASLSHSTVPSVSTSVKRSSITRSSSTVGQASSQHLMLSIPLILLIS